jgi:hypothetical protein
MKAGDTVEGRVAPPPTALAIAVLREVASLLEALVHDPSFQDAIDLRSLPLADADRTALRTLLGDGEVDVRLDVAGQTRVRETAFAGAWWETHYAADGAAIVERIVVARVPPVLLAHPADVVRARDRLGGLVAQATGPLDREHT